MNDSIFPAELEQRLADGEPFLVLDVREPHERSFCAIPLPVTAVDLHIPMGQVTSHLDDIRKAGTNIAVVVYCHHGVRSDMVAAWLRRQGLAAVLNLEGGIDAWSVVVDPNVPRYV